MMFKLSTLMFNLIPRDLLIPFNFNIAPLSKIDILNAFVNQGNGINWANAYHSDEILCYIIWGLLYCWI